MCILCSYCVRIVFALCTYCIHIVYILCSHCVHIVYILYTYCVRIVYVGPYVAVLVWRFVCACSSTLSVTVAARQDVSVNDELTFRLVKRAKVSPWVHVSSLTEKRNGRIGVTVI